MRRTSRQQQVRVRKLDVWLGTSRRRQVTTGPRMMVSSRIRINPRYRPARNVQRLRHIIKTMNIRTIVTTTTTTMTMTLNFSKSNPPPHTPTNTQLNHFFFFLFFLIISSTLLVMFRLFFFCAHVFVCLCVSSLSISMIVLLKFFASYS